MKNLKDIIQENNFEVSMPFFDNQLIISPHRNVSTKLIIKYQALSREGMRIFKKLFSEFKSIEDLLDSFYSAFAMAMEVVVKELVSDAISVGVNTIDAEYIVKNCSQNKVLKQLDDVYKDYYIEYDKIISRLENAAQYRKERKNNRGRWTSATYGGDIMDAWGNQFRASTMNAIEGMGHSVINGVGNILDESKADEQKKNLFYDEKKRTVLANSVLNTLFDIGNHGIKLIINKAKIKFYFGVSDDDVAKANSMYNNLTSVSLSDDKKKEFAYNILCLNPYKADFYLGFYTLFTNNCKEITDIAQFFGIKFNHADLDEIVFNFIQRCMGRDLEELKNTFVVAKNKASELGIGLADTDKTIRLISENAYKYLEDYINNEMNKIQLNLSDESDIIRIKEKITDTISYFYLGNDNQDKATKIMKETISLKLKELSNQFPKIDEIDEIDKPAIVENETKANKMKNDICEYVKRIELEEKYYSTSIRNIESYLRKLDKKYRSVENHTYDTREEADKALSDINDNKDILKYNGDFIFRHEFTERIERIKMLNIDKVVVERYVKNYQAELKKFDSDCKKAKHYVWRHEHDDNKFWNGDKKDMQFKYGMFLVSLILSLILFFSSHWFFGTLCGLLVIYSAYGITNIKGDRESWERVTKNGEYDLDDICSQKSKTEINKSINGSSITPDAAHNNSIQQNTIQKAKNMSDDKQAIIAFAVVIAIIAAVVLIGGKEINNVKGKNKSFKNYSKLIDALEDGLNEADGELLYYISLPEDVYNSLDQKQIEKYSTLIEQTNTWLEEFMKTDADYSFFIKSEIQYNDDDLRLQEDVYRSYGAKNVKVVDGYQLKVDVEVFGESDTTYIDVYKIDGEGWKVSRNSLDGLLQ